MLELWNNEQTFYFTLYLIAIFFFFYEWVHTTGTLWPFSSVHPLRKDMYWATVNYNYQVLSHSKPQLQLQLLKNLVNYISIKLQLLQAWLWVSPDGIKGTIYNKEYQLDVKQYL